MQAGFSSEWVRQGMRRALAPVGEFIHVSAVYAGLAVLTTLCLSLVLPSMREQSRQLHEVVLAMFQADGSGSGPMDDVAALDWSMPAALPPVQDNGQPSGNTETGAGAGAIGAGSAEGEASAAKEAGGAMVADSLSFAHALAASLNGKPIPGVTDAQAHALRSYLARKYKIAQSVAGALVRTAFAIGREKKLDPQLLLAVVAIESRYNPFAESAVGAQGLMQVMTSVHRDKLKDSGGRASIFNPVVNMRVGAQILSDCIRRRGSLKGGLACYVGATGPSDGGYGARVLAERRRIALASGIAPDKDGDG